MKQTDLTVIILSYNTKDITDECLRRVKKATDYARISGDYKVETLVIGNASIDGSALLIRRKYPWVRLIQMGENVGYAKGNNIGMAHSNSPLILLLNSDAFVEKDTLVKALRFMRENEKCGVLSIKLTYPDGNFQPVGGYLPNPYRTIFWLLGLESAPIFKKTLRPIYMYDKNFYEKERKLEWASGAFLLLKREVFEKTGGFNESFFLYMEDVEWCKRINEKKFNILFTPSIKIVHLEGASSKNANLGNILKEQTEGLLNYHKIHYPKSFWLIQSVSYIGLILRFLFYKVSGDLGRAYAYKNVLHFVPVAEK